MKKTCMCLVLMVAAICLPSYVQAGIEDLKISLKPIMNEYTGNKVVISVKNTGNKIFRGNITLMVPEQWGAKPAGIVAFNVKPKKTIKKSWIFSNALNNPYNKYTVRVKIASGKSLVSAEKSILEKQIVIKGKKSSSVNLGEPRNSKDIKSSIFGTQTHFGQWWDYKKVLPLVAEAGFKWIRDEAYWGGVESVKGKFKVHAKYTAWINAVHARGINIIIPLGYGNKHYPYKDFEAFKKGYANYCAFMAKTFKGKVQIWELWNEPWNFNTFRGSYGGEWNAKPVKGQKVSPWMDKFVDAMMAAAKAIREVDPDAIITTNSDIPASYYFLDLLKERKGTHLFDGLSVHPYSFKTPPEIRPYGGKLNTHRDGVVVADDAHSSASEVSFLKKKMKSVGMKKDNIYMTEFGYTTFSRTKDDIYEGFTYSAQAKYLSRQMILQLAREVPLAIQYDFQDDTAKPEKVSQFGLVRHPKYNYAPKPSFFAMQRICSLFSSPVKLYKAKLPMAVIPDRYHNSKSWKSYEPLVVWDGAEMQPLGHVSKYLFKNGDNELIIVLWNAIRATDERNPLLTKNVIIGSSEYTNPLAIDILTGETYDIKSEVKGKKTFLKDVTIPDYPIVIKMFKK